VVLVGDTAKSRKGTSWSHVARLAAAVDETWARERVLSGLSSGEGLVWAVRDPITVSKYIRSKKRRQEEGKDFEEVVVDNGVEDKRLLVREGEFACALKMLAREGNVLSPLIRSAWDSTRLMFLTKNNPTKATDAHITIIGHITQDELRRLLTVSEAGNGFGNRFLYLCVRRANILPEGGHLDPHVLSALTRRLHRAVEHARTMGELRRDEGATVLWHKIYAELSTGRPGMVGALVARAEAQAMRLAMIYALLDESNVIRTEHLEGALAICEYCEASTRHLFGDAMGDPTADTILRALRNTPAGLTRTQICRLFGGHAKASEIDRALGVLAAGNLAHVHDEKTIGRPAERWLAAVNKGGGHA
jgi:hypothetical protein